MRALALTLLLVGCSPLAAEPAPSPGPPGTPASPARTPSPPPATIVAAGDIASCPSNGDRLTAALLDRVEGVVLALGDLAYESGTALEFLTSYGRAWGRHRDRTRPVPGSHEYLSRGAAPYYAYFRAAAGDSRTGYYSFDVGAWHVIALNSNCAAIGGCGRGSEQERWLRADLAAHRATCTLAYWHAPRYSSGLHLPEEADVRPLWDALYEAGAEVVLSGHDHHYERFAPQDGQGAIDRGRGVRQFVVGTGGASLRPIGSPAPNSEVVGEVFGVLVLTLRADGYDWRFVPVEGAAFSDSGSGTCHEVAVSSPRP